ncbi:MAG: DUF4190 domain-containing protein [Anaerolineaceae bacterium]
MSEQLPYTTYQSENRRTSTMAIVSLVAGILGLTFFPFIGSIVAVITGPMAKKEIQQSGGTLDGEGLATAGIVTGWIGIGLGVISCLVTFFAILVPLVLIPLGLFSIGNTGFLLPILLGIL